MYLVYNLAPGEGPESKKIGRPFDITVTPGEPWECRNEAFATALIGAIPQIVQAVPVAEPDPPQNQSYDTNEEAPPQEEPLAFQGGDE